MIDNGKVLAESKELSFFRESTEDSANTCIKHQ